jgi:choline kinase
MKVLLMAAGRGSRISRYIEGKPKCTVDIGGYSLIEYTIQQLLQYHVDEIGMVLGYHGSEICRLLKGYGIRYYYNYFYDVTNSIASAWFARDFIDDDIVLMNADVYLEQNLIKEVFEEKKSPVLFSDSSRKEQADYKFYYEDGQLIKFGKELKGQDVSGEYVGVARMDRGFIPAFQERLQELVAGGKHHMWWEDVLYSYVGEREVYVNDINGMFWDEVDYIDEYERILKHRGYEIDFNVSVKRTIPVI